MLLNTYNIIFHCVKQFACIIYCTFNNRSMVGSIILILQIGKFQGYVTCIRSHSLKGQSKIWIHKIVALKPVHVCTFKVNP